MSDSNDATIARRTGNAGERWSIRPLEGVTTLARPTDFAGRIVGRPCAGGMGRALRMATAADGLLARIR